MHHRRAWVDLAKADQPVALHALAARVALVVRVHLVRLVPAVLRAQVLVALVRLVLVRLLAQRQALLAQAQALAEAAVAASAAAVAVVTELQPRRSPGMSRASRP